MSSYPSAWGAVTLADAATWLSGGTPRTDEPSYWNGDIPWITSGSLTEWRLKRSDRRLTAAGVSNGSRLVPAGTVIFVVRGMSLKTEFRIGIVDRPVAFGQDCKALQAVDGLDPLYLAYAIKAQTAEILDLVDEAGHGTGRLNTDQIKAVRIGLPPIEEQRAIAGVLGALDDKIESNRRMALGCEQLLATAAAFGPSGSLVPLADLVESTRVPVDPLTLGDSLVDHFSIPAFDSERLPESCAASTIKSGKFAVERRSVLVSRLNPSTPRVWLADPGARPAMCSTEFLVLRPKGGRRLVTVWLASVSEPFTAEAERRAIGTSFSHQRIKPDDALSIEVPDMGLLDAALLAEADAWLERALQARRESAAAIALRDALLPELLSGRLRVRDAEQAVSGAV